MVEEEAPQLSVAFTNTVCVPTSPALLMVTVPVVRLMNNEPLKLDEETFKVVIVPLSLGGAAGITVALPALATFTLS